MPLVLDSTRVGIICHQNYEKSSLASKKGSKKEFFRGVGSQYTNIIIKITKNFTNFKKRWLMLLVLDSTRVDIICLQYYKKNSQTSKKGSKNQFFRGGGVSILKYHKIYSKKIKVKKSGYMFTRTFFF